MLADTGLTFTVGNLVRLRHDLSKQGRVLRITYDCHIIVEWCSGTQGREHYSNLEPAERVRDYV